MNELKPSGLQKEGTRQKFRNYPEDDNLLSDTSSGGELGEVQQMNSSSDLSQIADKQRLPSESCDLGESSIVDPHTTPHTDVDHNLSEKEVTEVNSIEVQAPNGGWGWMCVLGCAMMHFFLGGFTRSYGVIYLQLIKRFDSSSAITAWVGGVATAVRMGGSPLGSGLANRFSARRVAFTGGLLLSMGAILSGLAPNVEYMFFSYSFLAGIGGTFMYAPGIVVVGQYFTTKRSIAIGLSTAGSGLGVFIIPPLLDWIFEYYGYFGGMLLMGSIVLHTCISGLLYRPLHLHKTQQVFKNQISKPSAKYKAVSLNDTGEVNDLQTGREESDCQQGKEDVYVSRESIGHLKFQGKAMSKNFKVKEYAVNCWASVVKYIDFTLLMDVDFLLFVITQSLQTVSYISAQMLLPAHAQTRQSTNMEAAFLLSIVGISDTIGRVTSGFVFGFKVIRPKRLYIYNASIFISALTCFGWVLASSYKVLVVVTVFHGLFNGTVVSQRAVMVSDLMGVEKLSSTFGLTTFGQGVALMAGPAIAGMLKDLTGTYSVSMVFAGVSSTVAAGTFLIINIRKCYKLHHVQKKNSAITA